MDSFCGESFLRVYDKMLGLGAIWAASLLGPGGAPLRAERDKHAKEWRRQDKSGNIGSFDSTC